MVGVPRGPQAWKTLSVRHLFLLAPWVGIVVGASRSLRDNSFLWHVRAGTVQLDAGQVLTTDPFSFTVRGAPWRTQSWLADLLYGRLERATGHLDWVPWFLIIVAALTFVLAAVRVQRRDRGTLAVAVSLLVLVWLGVPNLVPRPVVLSYLLLAALLVALETDTEWAAPLLVWVWAGVHGSFVLGLALIVLHGLRRKEAVRRWGPVALVAAALATATAHGIGVWGILFDFLRNREALGLIREWAVPDLTSPANAAYALLIAAILFAGVRGRYQIHDLWVVIPFLLFGLTSERAVFPAALVLVPWGALALPARSPKSEPVSSSRAVANWLIAAAIVVLPLLNLVSYGGIDPERFPVEAARHLDAGPVWHDDVAGGYLIYAQWPDRSVFIDDRAELYGAAFFREFVETRGGAPAWRDTFARVGITQALVRADAGLATVLEQEGWPVRYRDERWAVFESPGR